MNSTFTNIKNQLLSQIGICFFLNHRSVYEEVVDVYQSFFSKGLFLGSYSSLPRGNRVDGFSKHKSVFLDLGPLDNKEIVVAYVDSNNAAGS